MPYGTTNYIKRMWYLVDVLILMEKPLGLRINVTINCYYLRTNRWVSRDCVIYKFLVSEETVVLRRWERSKQKFGFIKRVDKVEITTVKDLESWRFER